MEIENNAKITIKVADKNYNAIIKENAFLMLLTKSLIEMSKEQTIMQ